MFSLKTLTRLGPLPEAILSRMRERMGAAAKPWEGEGYGRKTAKHLSELKM
jgi:hypothetical protein